MDIFLLKNLQNDISRIDLIGIITGHIIFGIALTYLFDWSWLRNLMSEEEKEKMLSGYNWKDLLADAGFIAIIAGIILLLISIFFK